MKSKKILIVDDEKNTRLTLGQCLERTGFKSASAVNAEEGLKKLDEDEFGLILLDLRMPGMGGMEFLKKVRQIRPDIKVVIITAYGTIDLAVEAMKLGAVDFLQKPFTPDEIRELVSRIMKRETLKSGKIDDYETLIELAKRSITERNFETAREYLKKAIMNDLAKADAFDLLGVLEEVLGNRSAALQNYRIALAKDPTYEPARKNLDRATSFESGDPSSLKGSLRPSPGDKVE